MHMVCISKPCSYAHPCVTNYGVRLHPWCLVSVLHLKANRAVQVEVYVAPAEHAVDCLVELS